MMLLMLSLAGLPPTAGFYAKLAVFNAAVSAGHLWLAVAAVLLSLVGAYYYLRIVKLMYFDDPTQPEPVRARLSSAVLMSVNGLALLVFGVAPELLMEFCYVAIAAL
jgi:NADH-quinone oxidoreductase subunit N